MVLGWPLAILLPLLGIEGWYWLRGQFPQSPPVLPIEPRVVHPAHQYRVQAALSDFATLPPVEQRNLRAYLTRRIIPLSDWLERLSAQPPTLLCLGENHKERTRRFLARRFFTRYPVEALLLETPPTGLARIEARLRAGWPYVTLLGADIAGVIRTVQAHNARTRVIGVDASPRQRRARARLGLDSTREATVHDNVQRAYRPGERHVVLFGALHCSAIGNWLYARLWAGESLPADRLLNVRVLGEHQSGPLEAFVHLLDAFGLPRASFAIDRPARLHPQLRRWFPLLDQSTLQSYAALLVFRT